MFRSKEKDKLFILLLELAGLLKKGTTELQAVKVIGIQDINTLWKTTEHNKENAQMLLNQVMKELDLSLITPIEREDILHLAERLNGTISSIEACAARFDIYGVSVLTSHMEFFVDLMQEVSELIYESVEKLTGKKFGDMQIGIQLIYGKVEAGHQLERKAIKDLFSEVDANPLTIIKEKDVYDFISRSIRQQEKVAKVLGTIIMKNA